MRSNFIYIFCTCLLICILVACTKKSFGVPPASTPTDSLSFSSQVFASGEAGYNTYRIPAIVKTNDGGLLAFIEGRLNSSADFGNIKILAKKSMDNGKTWGTSVMIAQNGNLQADNATPVVDNTDPNYPQGRIFLFYCTGNNTQANVTNLNGVREVWYITSSDNGQSWSAPVNITLQVHHPYQPSFNPAYTDSLKWTAYATGPGHALQITQGNHKGRIVVPINHGIFANKTNYAAAFYSDDHGKTFHLSPDVLLQSDETIAAELPAGGVLLNSRNQYLGGNDRILSYDNTGDLNGSVKWQTSFNPTLPDPVCQASMINYTNSKGNQVLLFSNPVSPDYTRNQLGIRQSFDWGKTWTKATVLDGGPAAYSDLVILPSGHIGVVYEAGNYSSIKFISFQYDLIPLK